MAWCCWCDRRDIPSATAKDHWSQCEKHPANERIAALEARLAAAERERDLFEKHAKEGWSLAAHRATQWKEAEQERDEAVKEAGAWAERASLARSEERERCLWYLRNQPVRHTAEEAIRVGRPAPKS